MFLINQIIAQSFRLQLREREEALVTRIPEATSLARTYTARATPHIDTGTGRPADYN